MNININSKEDVNKFKSLVDNELSKLDEFFNKAEQQNEETLFTIETGFSTWYVDYDRANNLYNVCKDEKFRIQRKSLGDALEYIFDTLGGTRLKLIK